MNATDRQWFGRATINGFKGVAAWLGWAWLGWWLLLFTLGFSAGVLEATDSDGYSPLAEAFVSIGESGLGLILGIVAGNTLVRRTVKGLIARIQASRRGHEA